MKRKINQRIFSAFLSLLLVLQFFLQPVLAMNQQQLVTNSNGETKQETMREDQQVDKLKDSKTTIETNSQDVSEEKHSEDLDLKGLRDEDKSEELTKRDKSAETVTEEAITDYQSKIGESMKDNSVHLLNVEKTILKLDDKFELGNFSALLKDSKGNLHIFDSSNSNSDIVVDLDTKQFELDKKEFKEQLTKSDKDLDNKENPHFKESHITLKIGDYETINLPIIIVSSKDDYKDIFDDNISEITHTKLLKDKKEINWEYIFTINDLDKINDLNFKFSTKQKESLKNINIEKILKSNGVDEEDILEKDPELKKIKKENSILENIKLGKVLEAGYKYKFIISSKIESDEENYKLDLDIETLNSDDEKLSENISTIVKNEKEVKTDEIEIDKTDKTDKQDKANSVETIKENNVTEKSDKKLLETQLEDKLNNETKKDEEITTIPNEILKISPKTSSIDVYGLRSDFASILRAASQAKVVYNVPSAATEGFTHYIEPGTPKTVKVGDKLYLEWNSKLSYTKKSNITASFIDHIDAYFTTTLDSGLGKPEIVAITKNGSKVTVNPSGNSSNDELMNSAKDVIDPKKDTGTVDYIYTVRAPITNIRDNYVMDFNAESVFKVPAGTTIKDPLGPGGRRLVTQDEITIIQSPRREFVNANAKSYGEELYNLNNELQTVYVKTGYAGEQTIAGDYINENQIKWIISQANITKGDLIYPVELKVDDSQDIKSVKVHYYKTDYENPQNGYILEKTQEADESLNKILVKPGCITQVEIVTDIINPKTSHEIPLAKLEGLKADLTIKKLWQEGSKPLETKFTLTGGQNNDLNETLTIPAGSETVVKSNLPKFTSYGMDGKRIRYDVSENKQNGMSLIYSVIDDATLTYTFMNATNNLNNTDPTGECTDYGVISLDPVILNEYYFSNGWYSYGGRITGKYRIPANSKSGDYFTLTLPEEIKIEHGVDPYSIFFNMVNSNGTVIGYVYHVEERTLKFVLNSNATSSKDYIGDFVIGKEMDITKLSRVNGGRVDKSKTYYKGIQPVINKFYDPNNKKNNNPSLILPFDASYNGNTQDLTCSKVLKQQVTTFYKDSELGKYGLMHKRIYEQGADYIVYDILLNAQNSGLYTANGYFYDVLSDTIELYNGNNSTSYIKDIEVYEVEGMRNLGYKTDSLIQVYPQKNSIAKTNVSVFDATARMADSPVYNTLKYNIGVKPTHRIGFKIDGAGRSSVLIRVKVRRLEPHGKNFYNGFSTGNSVIGIYADIVSEDAITTGSATGNVVDEYQIKLQKVDSKGNPIKNNPVVFRVTDISGNEVGVYTSDENGLVVINGLKKYESDSNGKFGRYKLTEIESPREYIVDKTEHNIYVDNEGVVWFDAFTDKVKRYDGIIPINIVNEESYSLKIRKVDQNGAPIKGAGFNLKNSDGTYDVNIDSAFNTDNFTFNSLKPGDYTLIETKIPNGYKGISTPITFTVEEDGKITKTSIDNNESSEVSFNESTRTFEINVINVKKELGTFTINKTCQLGTPLGGAEFTLTPIEPAGSPIVKISREGSGEVKFDGLKPGIYTLVESRAPDGFMKSTKEWRVYVNSDGKTFIQEIGAIMPDTELINGQDLTSKITKFSGNVTYTEKNNDGKINFGTEENKISVNMNIEIPGEVNPGDYFTIKSSDTLHYNMFQPDKIIYPQIVNGGKVIAKAKYYGPNMSIDSGTNKEITYVFNENVEGLKDLSLNLVWEDSINTNVVQNSGNYEFYAQLQDKKISNKFNVDFPTPTQKGAVNLKTIYKYTNDQNGNYTQLAYINPLKLSVPGESTIKVYPAVNSNYFNMADISPDKTNIKVYKFKPGATMPEAVVFDQSKLDLVDPSQYTVNFTTKMENRQQVPMAEIKLNVNSDAYMIVIDSEMIYKPEGETRATMLGQYVHFVDDKGEYARIAAAIATTGGSGSGSGTDNYTPPTLDVVNEKEETNCGKFEIKKIDEEGNILPGAEFSLYRIIDDVEEDVIYRSDTTDEQGRIVFDELEKGQYRLRETKAPDGYTAGEENWLITIDENCVTSYKRENFDEDDSGGFEPLYLNKGSGFDLLALRALPIGTRDEDVKLGNFTNQKVDNSNISTKAEYISDNKFKITVDITAGENKEVPGGIDADAVFVLNSQNTSVREKQAILAAMDTYGDNAKIGLIIYNGDTTRAINSNGLKTPNEIKALLNSFADSKFGGGRFSSADSAMQLASAWLSNPRPGAIVNIVHFTGGNTKGVTDANAISSAISGLRGLNGFKVYNYLAGAIAFSDKGNWDRAFATNSIDSRNFTVDNYLSTFPKYGKTVIQKAVDNAKLQISFNNNFRFVNGSIVSDKNKASNTQWDNGYDANTNSILLKSGELTLEPNQTGSISFIVESVADMEKAKVYDLINSISYKPNARVGATTIASPTVTVEGTDGSYVIKVARATQEAPVIEIVNKRAATNIEIIKKNAEGEKLPNAEFELYKQQVDENKELIFEDDAKTKPSLEKIVQEDKETWTTNQDGKIDIENLSDGTYYLKEIKAPEGYIKITKNIGPITIKDGKVSSSQGDSYFIEYIEQESSINRITITNNRAEYPRTGGQGSQIFYLVGTVLMIFAYIIHKRKKVIIND
ncbi:LPXTG cell wall anchor domain-containing protein [Helcococcus kunzii]|uniref:SpaA isopeptide-forming pilin-related protein n=1 Tax=Helcococcus kunzii TaxID=40091 RepID=UPI001C970B7C|nr:SpaA isopeptide-forming pilin-related protein [Helcococcus kunzii]QZO76444.1 LPXTG cell wall anchor domain-containing protein [Helcococcus kunzii]